jgi:hypothetical protein
MPLFQVHLLVQSNVTYKLTLHLKKSFQATVSLSRYSTQILIPRSKIVPHCVSNDYINTLAPFLTFLHSPKLPTLTNSSYSECLHRRHLLQVWEQGRALTNNTDLEPSVLLLHENDLCLPQQRWWCSKNPKSDIICRKVSAQELSRLYQYQLPCIFLVCKTTLNEYNSEDCADNASLFSIAV